MFVFISPLSLATFQYDHIESIFFSSQLVVRCAALFAKIIPSLYILLILIVFIFFCGSALVFCVPCVFVSLASDDNRLPKNLRRFFPEASGIAPPTLAWSSSNRDV